MQADFVGLSQLQAKKLFGCSFTKQMSVKNDMVQAWSYQCDNTNGTPKNHASGDIIYLKPYFSIVNDFKKYLENQKLTRLSECITNTAKPCYGSLIADKPSDKTIEAKYRFPQTDTMLQRYDEPLIGAYYMLGKYVAETNISRELRNYKPE